MSAGILHWRSARASRAVFGAPAENPAAYARPFGAREGACALQT